MQQRRERVPFFQHACLVQERDAKEHLSQLAVGSRCSLECFGSGRSRIGGGINRTQRKEIDDFSYAYVVVTAVLDAPCETFSIKKDAITPMGAITSQI